MPSASVSVAADHAPLLVGLGRGLADVDRLREVEPVGGVRRDVLVAEQDRVVDDAVAVVVEVVAGRVERARVDELGLAALGRVAAVTAAGRLKPSPSRSSFSSTVPLQLLSMPSLHRAVLADRDDLALALGPHPALVAGPLAADARADALGPLHAGVAILDVARLALARQAAPLDAGEAVAADVPARAAVQRVDLDVGRTAGALARVRPKDHTRPGSRHPAAKRTKT